MEITWIVNQPHLMIESFFLACPCTEPMLGISVNLKIDRLPQGLQKHYVYMHIDGYFESTIEDHF